MESGRIIGEVLTVGEIALPSGAPIFIRVLFAVLVRKPSRFRVPPESITRQDQLGWMIGEIRPLAKSSPGHACGQSKTVAGIPVVAEFVNGIETDVIIAPRERQIEKGDLGVMIVLGFCIGVCFRYVVPYYRH